MLVKLLLQWFQKKHRRPQHPSPMFYRRPMPTDTPNGPVVELFESLMIGYEWSRNRNFFSVNSGTSGCTEKSEFSVDKLSYRSRIDQHISRFADTKTHDLCWEVHKNVPQYVVSLRREDTY